MVDHLDAARGYIDRGWSILPMRMAEKRPVVRWKRYQRKVASDATIYRWFRRTDYGVGVIFGRVSGGLASRDFDDADAYHRWAEQRPALASTLPTVATRRGFHVYCRAWPESVQEARRRLGSHGAKGAIHLRDGELRAGVGCYSVLPPSTHPSGHVYGWSVPLPDGDLPTIDLCDVGFFEAQDAPTDGRFHPRNTVHTEYTVNTSNRVEEKEVALGARSTPGIAPSLALTVERAIEDSLPTRPGQRHKLVFELARRLKAVPSLADRPSRDLRSYVEAWHRRAVPIIGTKPFEETWIDFLKAWENVRHPYGEGVLTVAFGRACSAGVPALADDYEQSEILLLAGLCRELQRIAGDGPFFLSCRDAGQLLGVSHVQAARWLFLLESDGVLELVAKGDMKTRRASEFRYLAP
ncbi:hypothetical protein MalM25_19850 [Planctomycetes bacterium MalM25]|nr:hypothetical protein MalM25_19850 [Planctomycetes bacterium MalM25]